jgi:hypothetical protein
MLGTCVLGISLVAGCSHSRDLQNPPVVSTSTERAPVVVAGPRVQSSPCTACQEAPPTPAYPAYTQQPATWTTSELVALARARPVDPASPRVIASSDDAAPARPMTAIQQVSASEPATEAPPQVSAPTPRAAVVQSAVVQAPEIRIDDKPSKPRGEDPPKRRSYTDITAAACFGHAADYSWLGGQLEQTRLGKGWRLRFASVDEDEPHGGTVSLTGDIDLPSLKDGDFIRVRGYLVDPNDRGRAPIYHVESYEPVN